MSDMNSMKQEIMSIHNQRKEKVCVLLEKVSEYFSDIGDEQKSSAFLSLKQNVENGEFSIVLIGEFSAGKSTFLNALMHKKILTSFTSTTTATVNFLRHKNKSSHGENGIVYYKDGTTRKLPDISEETIAKYTSTKDKTVTSTISHVDLFLESEFLDDGVMLVDSPGLNTLEEGHKEITYTQILNSHASIFVFNSKKPGSETDFEALKDLKRDVKTIFLVLNQIDLIKTSEGETVDDIINKLKESYKRQYPEEKQIPEIWPISAGNALLARDVNWFEKTNNRQPTENELAELENSSRMRDFEERLLTFITNGEKTKEELKTPVEKVLSILGAEKKKLEEEKKILSSKLDTAELEKEMLLYEEKITKLGTDKRITKKDIKNKTSEAFSEAKESIAAEFSEYIKRRKKSIEIKELEELNDMLASLKKDTELKINMLLASEDNKLREKMMNYADETYDDFNKSLLDIKTEHLSVDIVPEKTEVEVSINMDKLEEKTKIIEEEIAALKEKQNEAQENVLKQRRLENEILDKKTELDTLKGTLDMARGYIIPQPMLIEKQTKREEKRGGLLGGITNILIGKKTVIDTETVKDTSLHDEAKEYRDKTIAETQQKIGMAEVEIANLRRQENDIIGASIELQNIKAEKDALMEKQIRIEEEKQKEIDQKYNIAKKKCQNIIEGYYSEVEFRLISLAERVLRNSKDKCDAAIAEIANAKITQQTENYKKRIEAIKEQLYASENDKAEKIKLIDQRTTKADELLSEANDVFDIIARIDGLKIKNEDL